MITARGRRHLKLSSVGAQLLAVVLFAVLLVGTPGTAQAACNTPVSSPNAGQILENYKTPSSECGYVVLREGDSSFGRAHIAAGGSTRQTANHELTDFAKQQWRAALEAGAIRVTSGKLATFRHVYTINNGAITRTMCVVVDLKIFPYSNKNLGEKGIITAYWVSGVSSCPAGGG